MNILEQIVCRRKQDVEEAKAALPLADLCEKAFQTPAPPDFAAALKNKADEDVPAIIAEIKRASPSKGPIREDFDPVALAGELASNGAAALSVLTEPHYFYGSSDYLEHIVENVPIPVLCKDFVVDSYQIYQARQWGASAVLLITQLLSHEQMVSLSATAVSCGLSVLAEVHSDEEIEKVLSVDMPLIGINSRNLKTFDTNLQTTLTLVQNIPENRTIVAESGISTPDDMMELAAAGVDACLIGESLMRSSEPGKKLQQLRFGHFSDRQVREP